MFHVIYNTHVSAFVYIVCYKNFFMVLQCFSVVLCLSNNNKVFLLQLKSETQNVYYFYNMCIPVCNLTCNVYTIHT
jgi:hypothetical protein